MRTNENKKRKTSRTMGAGSTSGCGMIVFILPAMPAHSHAIKICQHSPASSASVHADAIPRFASPPHSCRAQPMPALSPRSRSSPPLTAPQAAPATQGCSHVHMCPTGVVIVGGLADSSAMGSCVHCIQSRVSMSRRRRRRRGV